MIKAKQKRVKRVKGERVARVQKLYAFDVERARKLRDEDYKGKENTIALTLRGLIAMNKEELTFEQIAAAAKDAGVKRADRNTLPMKLLKKERVLKATKASTQLSAEKPAVARKAAPKPKAKRVRKPKAQKQAGTASGDTANEVTEAEELEEEIVTEQSGF